MSTTDDSTGRGFSHVREAVERVLGENGIGDTAPDGLHSWRCEFPDQYGPCGCKDELVRDLAAVLALFIEAEKVAAWEYGHATGAHDVVNCQLWNSAPSPNPYRAATYTPPKGNES